MTDPETLAAAVTEVRREWRKAVAVSAAADGVLALLAANLALTVVVVDLPTFDAVPVETRALVAALVGLLAGVASWHLRARRDAVERFESANPGLGAALRSARDAADSAHDDPMARRCYDDALDRLQEASSGRLLDERRLAVRTAVVFAFAMASLHLTVAGVAVDPLAESPTIGGGDGPESDRNPDEAPPEQREQFDDESLSNSGPSSVMGDPGDVTRGDDALAANVSGPSDGAGSGDERARYENSGHPSAEDVSPERAGYDDPSTVEDPDLVREYALRVSEEDEDD